MNDARREVRVFDRTTRADRPPRDGEHVSAAPGPLRMVAPRIEYITHPSFDDPDAREAILAEMPGPSAAEGRRRSWAPASLRPEMAVLFDVPFLSREQEAHLFRKMNYLKSLAEKARARLDPEQPRRPDLEEFERLQTAAAVVKHQIVRANLRLVFSIARGYVGGRDELAELVSIGNIALIRAVDKFDFARGHKFSTFATWVVRNELSGALRRDRHPRERLVREDAMSYRDAVDTRADPIEQESAQDQREQIVARLLARLDERERRILVGRFGIGGAAEETLRQIGVELGITKERVRQIESRAHGKLRQYAGEVELLLPSA